VTAACARDDRATPVDANGATLPVGLINLEGSPSGSVKDLRLGVEAAVAYINAELNGVNGRPLELEVCITSSAPEVSAACAQQLVERKAVAVIGGVDVGSASSLPVLTAAGIPYLGAAPLLPADYTTDGAFMFDPGGMAIAITAAYAVDELDAARVTILRADDRAAIELTDSFARPTLSARGIADDDITVVAEQANAADLIPAVTAVKDSAADAVVVLYPPPACARVMQAAESVHLDVPMFYIGRCGDPSILEAGGAGADGAYFVSSLLNPEANADDPDVRTYVDAVEEHGSDELAVNSFDSARGFATTMTVYRRLLTLDADAIDARAIAASFRSARDEPVFMGRTYTCDGKQAAPAWIAVCNVWGRVYQFSDGAYRDVSGTWVSAVAALTNA
jgi:branched-chain amino acid transport system substrate-binding protein